MKVLIQGEECHTRQAFGGRCSHSACIAIDHAIGLMDTGKYNLGTVIDMTRRDTRGGAWYPPISYSALHAVLKDLGY